MAFSSSKYSRLEVDVCCSEYKSNWYFLKQKVSTGTFTEYDSYGELNSYTKNI